MDCTSIMKLDDYYIQHVKIKASRRGRNLSLKRLRRRVERTPPTTGPWGLDHDVLSYTLRMCIGLFGDEI